MVLLRDLLTSINRYWVNIYISSSLLASLLDLGELKVHTLLFLCEVYRFKFLLGDIDVVVFIKPGVVIPWPGDLPKLLQPGVVVQRHPFILNLNEVGLDRHRFWATVGRDFL